MLGLYDDCTMQLCYARTGWLPGGGSGRAGESYINVIDILISYIYHMQIILCKAYLNSHLLRKINFQ